MYHNGKRYGEAYRSTDFNFRKYNPEFAIFEQPDTVIKNVYDPQNLNRYMFERGNPYKYTDETGHNPVAIIFIVTFAIFLAIIDVQTSIIEHNKALNDQLGNPNTGLAPNPGQVPPRKAPPQEEIDYKKKEGTVVPDYATNQNLRIEGFPVNVKPYAGTISAGTTDKGTSGQKSVLSTSTSRSKKGDGKVTVTSVNNKVVSVTKVYSRNLFKSAKKSS